MLSKRTNSIFNVIATGFLAYIATIPVHELIHLITFYAYGDKCEVFTAFSVHEMNLIDYMSLPVFDRIMACGGSASLFNVIIGIVVFTVLLKVKAGPMVRIFLIQLMGMHFSEGFSYFVMGGFFQFGDWGNVFSYFPNDTDIVSTMRIVLEITGVVGGLFTVFALSRFSYAFISDPNNRRERLSVSLKLYFIPFIVIYVAGIVMGFNSYLINSEGYGIEFQLFSGFNFIPFVYAFLLTWLLNKPPKSNHFLYKLPDESHYIVWAISTIFILLDAIILAPGIQLNYTR